MTIPDDKLREMLEAARLSTDSPWYARGRFLSRVKDNTGMGGTLHTNHIANFADKETCAYVAACDPTTIAGLIGELLERRERDAAKARVEASFSGEPGWPCTAPATDSANSNWPFASNTEESMDKPTEPATDYERGRAAERNRAATYAAELADSPLVERLSAHEALLLVAGDIASGRHDWVARVALPSPHAIAHR